MIKRLSLFLCTNIYHESLLAPFLLLLFYFIPLISAIKKQVIVINYNYCLSISPFFANLFPNESL